MSYIKGCTLLGVATTSGGSYIEQESQNPNVYTKLSCFLPWIADQYGMEYDQSGEEECVNGVGNKTEIAEECRIADSLAGEAKCIFPFYFNGKKYDQCTMLEEDGFIIPVFSCPVHNITRKIDGINHFIYSDLSKQLSPGPAGEAQHYIANITLLSNIAHMSEAMQV